MADTFHFELTSPEQTLVSADLSEAVLHGQEGDLAAMPGRALMIMKLRPGILTTRSKEGDLSSGSALRPPKTGRCNHHRKSVS